MERVGNLLCIFSLSIIIWQDFRSRTVSLWTLLLILGGFLLSGSSRDSFWLVGKSGLINLLLVALNLGLLTAWMKLRNGKIKIIDRYLGLGDILFFICIAFAFSPGNFIVFYSGGLLVVLLAALGIKVFRNGFREIPLAGALAIPLLLLCAWRFFSPAVNFLDDNWIEEFLTTYSFTG